MEVTVEISKYPLQEEFVKPIKDFIDRLIILENVTVRTNAISTQISGEYDVVMNILSDEIKRSFEQFGKSIFVMKVIPGNWLED